MKSIINEIINRDSRFKDLAEQVGQSNVLVTGLTPAAKASIIAELYQSDHRQVVLVTNNLYQADKIEADLLQFVPDDEVYKYPVQDMMTEEFSTQSPELMSERVRTLTALANDRRGLFIVPLNGLKKLLTPKEMWRDHQMTFEVGDDIEVDALLEKLVSMGYRRESVVSNIGEFSVRGGIIDVYPLLGEPIRIELFDTEVDSIRQFDVETQRSSENIDSAEITTAHDYIMTEAVRQQMMTTLKSAYETTRPKIDKSVRQDLKETYDSFQMVEDTHFDPQILRRLVAFMYEKPTTILDYLKDNAIILVDEYNRVRETEESLSVETEDFLQNLIESGKGFIGQRFMDDEAFDRMLRQFKITFFTLFTASMQMKLDDMIKFSCKPVQQFYGQYDIMTSEFQRYMRQEDRVVVMVETATKKERIQAMLSEMHIPTLLEP
ncbi:transcription-repair coupling factor, partial [Staphylococcus pseudintermedius]